MNLGHGNPTNYPVVMAKIAKDVGLGEMDMTFFFNPTNQLSHQMRVGAAELEAWKLNRPCSKFERCLGTLVGDSPFHGMDPATRSVLVNGGAAIRAGALDIYLRKYPQNRNDKRANEFPF